MGKIDTATVKYLRRDDIFADAFNFYLYHGKQIIKPESLTELDARELIVPYGGEKGEKQPVQRMRDVIKAATAMTDDKRAYLILAVENQAHIHYAMPVKNMVYDAMQYAKQVEKAALSHKKSGDYKGTVSDEFLSGFKKEDCLIPVITLVIYFGNKEWDGPLSIHEMFQEENKNILEYIPDYKMNLIAPAQISDDKFQEFQSSLKEVLTFIKYSEDKEKLGKILGENTEFQRIGRDEVDVINACTGTKLEVGKDGEVSNMCKAIEDMMKDAVKNERIENIKNLQKNLNFTVEQAMTALGIPVEEQQELRQML